MVCARCSAPSSKTCGTCQEARYCCDECQAADWTVHKHTCSNKVQVKRAGERGFGVFARATFEVGEELIREAAVIRMPNLPEAGGMAEASAVALFASLPEVKQRLVMSLSDAHHAEPTVWGTMKTNAIPTNDVSMPPSSGIFVLACRLNHSCKPNARYVWRQDLGRELVFAIRPISAGEEVTVQYTAGYLPRAERQSVLRAAFNFACACLACAEASLESDERRREIQMLIDRMPVVAQSDPLRALGMSERTLSLLEAEGADTPLDKGTIHNDAYQVACAMGDRRKMKEHLRRAWECAALCEGRDSPRAAGYAIAM